MSAYTTQIRWLVETGWDFGLKEYPIFDEAYRSGLNKKIIDHYYFREIGFETAALFNRILNRKMNEIMPYYNQLYKSELIKIEPLTRLNYTETYDRQNDLTAKTTTDSETTSNQRANSKTVNSDTPQGLLEIGDIENEVYASEATFGNDDSNTSSAGTSTANQESQNVDHYLKTIAGNNASRTDSEMIKEFRTTFLNIDMEIIDELSDLFMNVYDIPAGFNNFMGGMMNG